MKKNTNLLQMLEHLQKEIQRDEKHLNHEKKKLIKQIKTTDIVTELNLQAPPEQKLGFADRLKKIFGL
jgi:hypothetical protein